MEKKYELTEEEKVVGLIIYYQIRALKSFGCVKKEELGGWIEKESNLSQVGNAWVEGNAWVGGDARVEGNARVGGDARVEKIIDILTIFPLGSRNDTLTIHKDSKIGVRVTTGCFSGSIKEFRSAAIKKDKGDKDRAEYLMALRLINLKFKP